MTNLRKIKRKTIISPVEKGGLGMVNINSVHEVAKCSWIRRLFQNSDSKWKIIFLRLIGIQKERCNKNSGNIETELGKTYFHNQVLKSWFRMNSLNPNTANEIKNQYLLYNQYIIMNKTYIKRTFSD